MRLGTVTIFNLKDVSCDFGDRDEALYTCEWRQRLTVESNTRCLVKLNRA
jgi:hypothetical protein